MACLSCIGFHSIGRVGANIWGKKKKMNMIICESIESINRQDVFVRNR